MMKEYLNSCKEEILGFKGKNYTLRDIIDSREMQKYGYSVVLQVMIDCGYDGQEVELSLNTSQNFKNKVPSAEDMFFDLLEMESDMPSDD